MRILVVADDLLIPTNSGGRSEVVNMTEQLQQMGHETPLVVFHHRGEWSDDLQTKHLAIAPTVLIDRRPFLAASLRHPLLPYQVSSRVVPYDRWQDATDVGRLADIVLAHHEWTVPAAFALSARLGRPPVVLRSHNNEGAYFRALREHGSGLKRWYLAAEHLRIQRQLTAEFYEGLAAVLAISPQDAAGYAHIRQPVSVVPPSLFAATSGGRAPNAEPVLAFVGSLDMPHAVSGLLWYVENVLPEVHGSLPAVRLDIAGRRANPDLVGRLESNPLVRFHGEVLDPAALVGAARVFINPVFSGSGVTMKVGPAAAAGIPVITTSFGAEGLESFGGGLLVADDVAGQVAGTLRLLTNDLEWTRLSCALRDESARYMNQVVGQRLQLALETVLARECR